MGRPQPRLTIRRMIAVVAILGLVLGIAVLAKRSNDYRHKAEKHEEKAAVLEMLLAHDESHGAGPGTALELSKEVLDEERQARRFRAAQWRPWQAVPDANE